MPQANQTEDFLKEFGVTPQQGNAPIGLPEAAQLGIKENGDPLELYFNGFDEGRTGETLAEAAGQSGAQAQDAALGAAGVRQNADANATLSGQRTGELAEGAGEIKSILNAGSKADALKSVDELPSNIQSKVKSFFKGGSSSYVNFSVEPMEDGSYIVKMTKPGNVPGSKAIYYKIIDYAGSTVRVYKETYDPAGNLVHVKDK